MGCGSSRPASVQAVLKSKNDYETVIRASKELEHVLESEFSAQGKGLHENAESVKDRVPLNDRLMKDIHFLATIRNKLVHEYGFNAIPDRSKFLERFTRAEGELRDLVLAKRGGKRRSGTCSIM